VFCGGVVLLLMDVLCGGGDYLASGLGFATQELLLLLLLLLIQLFDQGWSVV
jgi:hypothetical protein